MARYPKKSLDERINEKQEIINSLNIRLDKEEKELEALLNEQKSIKLESIASIIFAANLSLDEATDILKQHSQTNV